VEEMEKKEGNRRRVRKKRGVEVIRDPFKNENWDKKDKKEKKLKKCLEKVDLT
jgi:hypothetical protein